MNAVRFGVSGLTIHCMRSCYRCAFSSDGLQGLVEFGFSLAEQLALSLTQPA